MTQGVDEQLSAFLDGELPAAEEELLLRRLERDTAVRERLARFAVIGQALRGGATAPGVAGLGDRVTAAIAAEDPHRVPIARPGLGGLATAGLAAAAGLIVLTGLVSLGSVSLNTPAQVAETRGAPIGAARLTGYLVAHGDYAGGISRQVTSSHVVNRSPDLILTSATGGVLDE